MDTITLLVGVLETALVGGEPTTSLSPLNALYALQNRAEAAEAEVERLAPTLFDLTALEAVPPANGNGKHAGNGYRQAFAVAEPEIAQETTYA